MKDRKLATRYAGALLAALPDPALGGKIEQLLNALAEAMEQDPTVRDALADPGLPRSARLQALYGLSRQQGLPVEFERFLETVVDHGRVAQLPAIAAMYRELRERALGVVPAVMTTAVPLEGDLRERARQALERLTGKRVRLDCEVDSSLLGGAVTRIGSTVYDGSLRTQLSSLRHRMDQE